MATKSKKQKETAPEAPAVAAAEVDVPKKMSKQEAQAIVDQYDGINGVDVPVLKKAKEVLKAK